MILSDPNVGAFAVLSILALLALRFSGINELINIESINLVTFMSVFVLPRIVAGWILLWDQPAKETGLASYFQKAQLKDKSGSMLHEHTNDCRSCLFNGK